MFILSVCTNTRVWNVGDSDPTDSLDQI
jgi:hypothetical protein